MKLVLENTRLKASIETLQRDLQRNRENELKMIEILRQSKEKMGRYKEMMKGKSRKVSEVTESNLELRGRVKEFEGRVRQLNAYSVWQEGQIEALREELEGRKKDEGRGEKEFGLLDRIEEL